MQDAKRWSVVCRDCMKSSGDLVSSFLVPGESDQESGSDCGASLSIRHSGPSLRALLT